MAGKCSVCGWSVDNADTAEVQRRLDEHKAGHKSAKPKEKKSG